MFNVVLGMAIVVVSEVVGCLVAIAVVVVVMVVVVMVVAVVIETDVEVAGTSGVEVVQVEPMQIFQPPRSTE